MTGLVPVVYTVPQIVPDQPARFIVERVHDGAPFFQLVENKDGGYEPLTPLVRMENAHQRALDIVAGAYAGNPETALMALATAVVGALAPLADGSRLIAVERTA
jgi:hypothetical protein